MRIFKLIPVLLVMLSTGTSASTVNYTEGVLNSITGLLVGETAYDVNFIYEGTSPQFAGLGSSQELETADDFLRTALLDHGVVGPGEIFLGPFFNTGNAYKRLTYNGSGWSLYGASESYVFGAGDSYAVFSGASVSPVPLPAAAWLFGSGLLGLAGIARRRQST